MAELSAGVLAYRASGSDWHVLLAHHGGPFFARKDAGAWTIPKGAPNPGEPLEAAARREFQEEIGVALEGPLRPLGSVRQRSGKIVHGFAIEVPFGPRIEVVSNDFELEWPPRSGKLRRFPEVDRAEFFPLDVAAVKIILAQRPLLERLQAQLSSS